MNAFLTLTIITRTKEDEHKEKVMHYLRKGYTIESTQNEKTAKTELLLYFTNCVKMKL